MTDHSLEFLYSIEMINAKNSEQDWIVVAELSLPFLALKDMPQCDSRLNNPLHKKAEEVLRNKWSRGSLPEFLHQLFKLTVFIHKSVLNRELELDRYSVYLTVLAQQEEKHQIIYFQTKIKQNKNCGKQKLNGAGLVLKFSIILSWEPICTRTFSH